MSDYIDLLIAHNDLILDSSQQPLLVVDRASIAQDIAHMIRDSGLLVTVFNRWSCWWRRTCGWYRVRHGLFNLTLLSQVSTWSPQPR